VLPFPGIHLSTIGIQEIIENEKKSTLCFLVYLKILFAHCHYNFHNFMKARNQMDVALDATHKLIQQQFNFQILKQFAPQLP
jgi:hypothetical protein